MGDPGEVPKRRMADSDHGIDKSHLALFMDVLTAASKERRQTNKENLEALNRQTSVFSESLMSIRKELRIHSTITLLVIIILGGIAGVSTTFKGFGIQAQTQHTSTKR